MDEEFFLLFTLYTTYEETSTSIFPDGEGQRAQYYKRRILLTFFVGIRLEERMPPRLDGPPRRRLFIFSFFFVPTWWWSLHNLFSPVYSCLFLALPAANFSCKKKNLQGRTFHSLPFRRLNLN